MADAKKLKQILTAIESATSQLAGELDKAHRDYLAVLAQSLRRQVVSACYSLCTQGYPERFLKLTTSQREQVQQTLQTAIAQSCAQLIDPDQLLQVLQRRRLQASPAASEAAVPGAEETPDTVVLKSKEPVQSGLNLSLLIRAARDKSADDSDGEAPQADPQADPQPNAQADEQPDGQPETAAEPEPEQDAEPQDGVEGDAVPDAVDAQPIGSALNDPSVSADDTLKAPTALLSRQKKMETAVAQVLDQLADDINDHLRSLGVLPQDLPEAVLEAVVKTGAAEVVEGPPNVLSLRVRADEEDAEVSPVMAIRLQISELEFNDAHLSAKRSHLRSLYGKLRKLSQKYEKYQREWVTVEAESAWRASWYEPS